MDKPAKTERDEWPSQHVFRLMNRFEPACRFAHCQQQSREISPLEMHSEPSRREGFK